MKLVGSYKAHVIFGSERENNCLEPEGVCKIFEL